MSRYVLKKVGEMFLFYVLEDTICESVQVEFCGRKCAWTNVLQFRVKYLYNSSDWILESFWEYFSMISFKVPPHAWSLFT